MDECNLDENTKKVLIDNINRKLTQINVKIRADFECSCFTYEGKKLKLTEKCRAINFWRKNYDYRSCV